MKNHIIFLTLTLVFYSTLLIGCTSMLTIGTATIVANTWYDSRTIGSQIDDSILKINIYHALNKHTQIKKFTRIINTVYQGNVLLTGQSPSSELSKEAINIVMHINGTKNIYNAIRKNSPISLQNILFDSIISNQIRFHLFTKKNTHISKIKVVTENREVFLLGMVTCKEGQYAEKIARKTKGVKNVFSAFTYI
ncbi:putative phospholipid-binding domain protein [Candidatus Blochmanniella vafra str. BVAF]|uniref:Phospholipid-binding domain protein n=1 Tax=Blochmanniella vafra (strain BVAF) TaxID=859654 RepID=E8Q6M3_BLOVB|nr:division/outer membrane stress-associated lipid-binding lipoprotein [Candidatus Blochmannia vafer]ADV33464.1 putative phospholipid-binding domain protein [Candidatus Blochmannia vafer str. BVAF]